MIVQRYMCSFDYNTRHFGTACDRGFQGLSMYHQSQKFGLIGSRLSPLPKTIVADLTDGEDAEEVPKDERNFYKKIYKHENMPVVALVKSFEIDWMKEQEVNKKTSKSLILSFQLALQILNTHTDLLDFFSKNLQLLELNTVALKHKGTHSLKSKVGKFSDEEFQENFIIIPNSSGQGFFKINFPKLEIYFQEYQHVEVRKLSPLKFLDLVKNNFFQLNEMISDIQIDINVLEKYKKQQLEEDEKRKKQQEESILQQIENKPSQENINQEEQQKATHNNQASNELGIIITEKKSEFPDKILIKKQVKHIVVKDEKYYFCVDFLPIQFTIREKVSQKIIKIYSLSFQEFNDFLIQLTTKNVQQIVEEYFVATFDIPPEAFDYKEFKKGTKIGLNLPKSSDLCSEIIEEHLNNGLQQSFMKEIEINNKDLQIIMEPCSLGIYNQTTCAMERRLCTSKELTSILQKKYQIQFKLV